MRASTADLLHFRIPRRAADQCGLMQCQRRPLSLRTMVAAIGDLPSRALVADFAAGEGALLSGSHKARWSDARLVADRYSAFRHRAVTAAVSRRSRWPLRLPQSPNRATRAFCPLRAAFKKSGRLMSVLLNPLFSGAVRMSRFAITLDDKDLFSSRALAFFVTAIKYVAPGGTLVGILPSSVLTAERDRDVWGLLEMAGAEVT